MNVDSQAHSFTVSLCPCSLCSRIPPYLYNTFCTCLDKWTAENKCKLFQSFYRKAPIFCRYCFCATSWLLSAPNSSMWLLHYRAASISAFFSKCSRLKKRRHKHKLLKVQKTWNINSFLIIYLLWGSAQLCICPPSVLLIEQLCRYGQLWCEFIIWAWGPCKDLKVRCRNSWQFVYLTPQNIFISIH